MTTGLQLALLGGAMVGLGLALVVWRLAPSDPDLTDALNRLSPTYGRRTSASGVADGDPDGRERLGLWAMKVLPAGLWGTIPARELAILQISVARFYGEKVTFALLGLLGPVLISGFFTLIGLNLPFVIPTFGALALAAVMWFLPNYNVHDDAEKARVEFSRVLGALERKSGSGSRKALEEAAQPGETWVFRRLTEEFNRSSWNGQPPWDSLRQLSEELGIPELDDLADIMRLSGEEGAQVYTNLRARGAAMRSAMLSAEVAKANAVAERMYIPGSLVGVIFMALLVAPALLRVIGGTG
jgi:hypothetical protein